MMVDSKTGVHKELLSTLPNLMDRSQDLPGDDHHRVSQSEFQAMLSHVRENWRLNASFINDEALLCPVKTFDVPVSENEPDVRVYLVGDCSGDPKPCILHFHGGGLISGKAKDYLPAIQAQALALDCLIATVEYRLAPESPFPAALNDAYAALTWLHEKAVELNVDRKRIGVQGESAGGGLAAMLAIAARDRKQYSICYQALIYPMLDDRSTDYAAQAPAIGRYRWQPKLNRLGWDAFLGWPSQEVEPPYGSVPARVSDLSNLPQTFIWVGGIDLFAIEDVVFSQRLIAHGVPVNLYVVPGVYHAFDVSAPESDITRQFRATLLRHWCQMFDIEFNEPKLNLFSK